MKWFAFVVVALVALAAMWPILDAIGQLLHLNLLPWASGDVVPPDPEDAFLRPAFTAGGDPKFWLGTDGTGLGVWTGIVGGIKISFGVGVAAVALAMLVGVPLGLASGYGLAGPDRLQTWLADLQRPFPPLIIALLLAGIAHAMLPAQNLAVAALPVLAVAVGIGRWPSFAATVRDAVRAERYRPYVDAARLLGLPSTQVAMQHVLPNVLTPALRLGLSTLGLAVMDEAALSYLGIGMPADTPSLGTMIRLGLVQADSSGAWWTLLFPCIALALPLVLIDLPPVLALLRPRRVR